jgi:hypothetical protein
MRVFFTGVIITQVVAFLANPITALPVTWSGGSLAESIESFGEVTNTIEAKVIPSLSNMRLRRRNSADDKGGKPPSGKPPDLRLVAPLPATDLGKGKENGANTFPERKNPENLLVSDNTPLTEEEWNAATEHLQATHEDVHEKVASRMSKLWTKLSGQTLRIKTKTMHLGPYHPEVQSLRALRRDTIAEMRKKTQSFAKLEEWAA